MRGTISNNIRIILVATTHAGNIGATARAMKTMGLCNLYLVEPKIFPHVDATARAAGADDLLAKAIITRTLDEALQDCQLIIGASARQRDLAIPLLDSHQAALKIKTEIKEKNHQVAVVFGRESNGLSNEELKLCHYHLNIPANSEFSSLNLAAAVQIVAYEIMMANRGEEKSKKQEKKCENDTLASHQEMQLFYQHLKKVLLDINFLNSQKSTKLMPRLRRLFNRARPEHIELNILRGILTAVEKSLKKDCGLRIED